MQNTVNLNLKKPDQNDFVNIGDINDNMDILDAEVAKKYVKPLAGIPSLDLDSATQAALKKAETALQTVTKSSVGLGNVDNTSDVNKPVSTAQQVALDKKANLASPSLTGTPTAPTAAESTNTQQIATTAFVDRAVKTHQADLVSHGIYGVATGTNALVMTDSEVTSYVDGMLVAFKNTTASTASTTLNINSLGAKAILKANGTAVNNLKTNAIYQLRYNGVNFILLGEGGEYGNVTANDVVAGKTFGTENGLQTGSATVASLGGIISSDIALFSAIANENVYEVSEVDKNTGKIAYGSYSTLPMIGCFGDLNGKMISQKSVNTPSYVRLVGWYIDYYVTYLPSSGVITFYNHDDNVIFSFNYIVNTGIYGICLYQDTVIITEFDSSTQTLLTTYKNKTGGTISSFSKILSSNLFTLGKNLKLNLYKVPFIYQYYIFSSDRYFTVGLIKLNGINTITHKRFYGDFTEPSLRFLKDYITK